MAVAESSDSPDAAIVGVRAGGSFGVLVPERRVLADAREGASGRPPAVAVSWGRMEPLPYQSAADARRERPDWVESLLGRDAGVVARTVARELGGEHLFDRPAGRHAVAVAVGTRTATIEFGGGGLATGLTGRATTRVTVPFAGRPGYQASARPTRPWDVLGEWAGVFDLQVGVGPFDRAFVLRGTDPGRARALFADDRVRGGLMAEPDGRLDVDGVGTRRRVSVALPGQVVDPRRLRGALGLARAALDRLAGVGVTA